jgi:maltose alpha-D-glucosyltransferase/alpha-amylase
MNTPEKLFELWRAIYPDSQEKLLKNFLQSIEIYRTGDEKAHHSSDWYKNAVVYSLYVELFNKDFPGLISKLDYLGDLGVNCIWLLPVLDSPMRDAGFDISDYMSIRPELGAGVFQEFLQEARKRDIRVIFDIAINHTSDQHHWFREALKSKDDPYRNFFIWSDHTALYEDARIIFKGIETSNWESCGDQFYFHRFFSFQPDLNYRNPEVLFAMCRNMLYWQNAGVDGFRADAIPYLWKEAGTSCENLPQTHAVVKFFRALLDYVKPGTLLLAEACQKPAEVVSYLGNGDECHAAYHFPLMPRIFKSIAMQSGNPIIETLSPDFTPVIPDNCQWFTFLRCHDELSLELVYVTEEERKYIHTQYCHEPAWDFRVGEGISARLAELMKNDPAKILLAYSIILTLPGTPVIYYGDEFAKGNDIAYYNEMIAHTGKDDTRFLVRGKIDWELLQEAIGDPGSLSSQVFTTLQNMLRVRSESGVFGNGSIRFVNLVQESDNKILAFIREFKDIKFLVIHNMSANTQAMDIPLDFTSGQEMLGNSVNGVIEPHGFRWIKL